MVNYNNGKIYKIVDNTNNNIYVGSTTKKYLSDRLSSHNSDYRRFKKINKGYITSFEILKNNNFDIILLELVNCNSKDELKSRERFYIETLDCVNKNIPGRTNKEYKETNKEKITEYNKEYRETNKEKIKEYRETNKEKIKENRETNKEKYEISNKNYRELNKLNKKIYDNYLIAWKNTWGGPYDIRCNNNNLLRIDVNLFA